MLTVSWQTPLKTTNPNKILASQWIRCLQLIPYLSSRGVASALNDTENSSEIAVFTRWQDERALTRARELRASGTKIVFDVNVNYFSPAIDEDPQGRITERHVQRCLSMAQEADAVTCASSEIATAASQHHNFVKMIPDSIDLRHFNRKPRKPRRPDGPLRLVWSGVSQKVPDLQPLFPTIRDLGLELLVITNNTTRVRRWLRRFVPNVEVLSWTYETFPHLVAEGDVALSPRDVSTQYNRGHSSFKLLALMSQGLPALASPVPSYVELLETGGGRICASPSEFRHWLLLLQENPGLLESLSHEALSVVKPYSTGAIASKYSELFTQLTSN